MLDVPLAGRKDTMLRLQPWLLSVALLASPFSTTPITKRTEKAPDKVTITKVQVQQALWAVNWEMKQAGQPQDVFIKGEPYKAFHVGKSKFLSFFNTNPELSKFKAAVTANGKWPLFEEKFYGWLKGVNNSDRCPGASDWDAEGAVHKSENWWEWKVMSEYLN